MPPPTSDHALRRLIVKLATLHRSDLEAVLEALDSAERQKAEKLLSTYFHDVQQEPANRFRLEGLSPWLAARVDMANPNSKAGGTPRKFDLTPIAAAALRQCAQDLGAEQPLASAPSAGTFAYWIAHLSGRDLRLRKPGRPA